MLSQKDAFRFLLKQFHVRPFSVVSYFTIILNINIITKYIQ